MIVLTVSGVGCLIMEYSFTTLKIVKVTFVGMVWLLGHIIDNMVEPTSVKFAFIQDILYSTIMENVDAYISTFPEEIQVILNQIRTIIKEKAPDAVESMAYGMPAYKTNRKPLVYFAGYKKHIGFYATPTGHAEFKKELSKFKQGKGSVQFPIDQPIPFDLIGQIVEFRVYENLEKAKK